MEQLAKNLYFLRRLNNLNQDQIKAGKGFSRTTWSNYENNVSDPNLSDFVEIIKYFGVSADAVLFDDMTKDVHLKEKMELWKKQLKSTPNLTPNSTSKGKNYPENDTPPSFVNDPGLVEKLGHKEEIISNQKQTIESLKQANTALSSLNTRLEKELNELKAKSAGS